MRAREEADTVQLSKIRVKEPLRAALERAAAERGVTMNAEIARRLEASFVAQEHAQKAFGEAIGLVFGRRLGGVLLLLGHAIAEANRRAQAKGRKNWREDAETYEFAAHHGRLLLAAVAPEGEVTAAEQERLGGGLSTWALLAPADEALAPLKELLGNDLIKRLAESEALSLPPPATAKKQQQDQPPPSLRLVA